MLLQTDAADGHDDLACIGIRSIGDLQIEFAIVLEQIAAAQRERREQREDECLAHGSSSLIEQAQYVGTSARSWAGRSEEHTSELQSLMRISYAVFCLKKQKKLHLTIN